MGVTEKLTVTVEEAGKLLGISRPTAYALAGKPGGIPVLRLGRRMVVPKAALTKMLNEVQRHRPGPLGDSPGCDPARFPAGR